MTEHAVTPVWQWTYDGDKVLLVKWVNKDGTSYGGFQWPESGPVEAPDWDPEPKCGGGLHGWPWGIGVGAGKEPDYSGRWLVFAADPEDVVWVDNEKAKCRTAEVVYCGPWWGAYKCIAAGQAAWIQHAASGAASATGQSGAASATGVGSVAAVTQATEYSHVEAGPGGIAAVIGEEVRWTVHKQAVLIQRWKHGNGWRTCLLYTSPSPRDLSTSRMPSSA